MSYSNAQMISQALTPKFSAFFSILGSTAILSEILFDGKLPCRGGGQSSSPPMPNVSGHSVAVERLLIGLSVSDVFFSTGWFLTTWPAPKETSSSYLWGAYGTNETCAAQGFIISLGFWGTPVYNTLMSLYYYLMIVRGWTTEQLLQIDPYIQAVLWAVVIVNSIVLTSLKLFNNYGVICYIQSLPFDCSDSVDPTDESYCIRGNEHAWVVALVEQIVPIWPCILLNMILMTSIYQDVKASIEQTASYAFRTSRPNTRQRPQLSESAKRQIKAVRNQSLSYVVAMMVCLIPDAIYATIYFTSDNRSYFNFPFETIAYMCLPLQGLLNFLIFIRQRRNASTVSSPISKFLIFLFLQNPVYTCFATTLSTVSETMNSRYIGEEGGNGRSSANRIHSDEQKNGGEVADSLDAENQVEVPLKPRESMT